MLSHLSLIILILIYLVGCIGIVDGVREMVRTNSMNGGSSSAQSSAGFNRMKANGFRQAKAKEMLQYMNPSADPCHDFYDFACGNWTAQSAIPQRSTNEEGADTEANPSSLLELRVQTDLQKILNDPITRRDSLSVSKVKGFYRSCLTVESPSQQQQTFLLNFVRKFGGLPSLPGTNWNINYDWVRIIGMLRANYNLDILIGLEIDPRDNALHLTEPKTTLIPEEHCNAVAAQQDDVKDYVDEVIQREVSENMQSWFNMRKAEANRFAGDILQFEFQLCKRMREAETLSTIKEELPEAPSNGGTTSYRRGEHRSRQSPNRQEQPKYILKSLRTLREQFRNTIDFKMFVDISLNTSFNDQVYLHSEGYFQQLAQTTKISVKPTLANYILYQALSHLSFSIDDKRTSRPKYCAQLVRRYFPKVLGEMYHRWYISEFGTEGRNDVQWIFEKLTQSFEESLNNAAWMEENSRRAVIQKLRQIKVRFPDYRNLDLSDLPLESNDYWRKLDMIMNYNAQRRLYNDDEYKATAESVESYDVNVKLLPEENIIAIGWALLQPPFYHHIYANTLKYSLIGQAIASQLITAFDDQGFSANPMNPITWDEYTIMFRNLSECYRTQFSNYLYNNPDEFRSASALRELIADANGLNIAFGAYLAWLATENSGNMGTLSKETLPDVNFTNTQLFFINFAQMRCVESSNKEPTPEFLPLDRQTSERYDVNGPLANYPEFAREFGCATGIAMNPGDKCSIFI